MDDHEAMTALTRLVASGWAGVLIGDPADPSMIVYTRAGEDSAGDAGPDAVRDELVVMDPDDVRASRTVSGVVVLTVQGSMTAVVEAVTAWPPLDELGRAS